MILADAHLHLFRRGFPGIGSLLSSEVDAYESLRALHGIAAGLVVGYEGEGIDPGNNGYIRSLAATRPWMATLAYIEPALALTPDDVAALFEQGHAGIAVYLPDAGAASPFAAWPAAAWRELRSRRAIVSLNASPEAAGAIARKVEANDGCTFLFSHLGMPGRYAAPPAIADAAERLAPLLALAHLPHVMVKVSGLYAISDPAHEYPHAAAAPFVDLVLDRFGPSRCLWGSDFSPALDFVSFAQTASNRWLDRLREDERTAVMGGNLLRLLGGEPDGG